MQAGNLLVFTLGGGIFVVDRVVHGNVGEFTLVGRIFIVVFTLVSFMTTVRVLVLVLFIVCWWLRLIIIQAICLPQAGHIRGGRREYV